MTSGKFFTTLNNNFWVIFLTLPKLPNFYYFSVTLTKLFYGFVSQEETDKTGSRDDGESKDTNFPHRNTS